MRGICKHNGRYRNEKFLRNIKGAVAQMVERVLSMHEVAGSIPASSIYMMTQMSITA